MVLATQSFGNEKEYRRAIFCLASFYAHIEDKSIESYLFTDNPVYFQKFFSGFPIKYFILTPEKIMQMRGSIDFSHRMKIALIEEAFESANQDLLYVDSDTFFLKDPAEKMNRVKPDLSFMHLPEYTFESMRDWMLPAGVIFRAFINLVSNSQFMMPNGSSLKVNTSHYSWNAGVMMFHASHKRFIPEVYTLTDQFYPATNNHACEQYAFSIVLQRNTTVHRCDDVSYHYWYRVKKLVADDHINELVRGFESTPIRNLYNQIRKATRQLPSQIENNFLYLRDVAIQSFNENKFSKGYQYSFRVLLKNPLNFSFMKDILYHSKRFLLATYERKN